MRVIRCFVGCSGPVQGLDFKPSCRCARIRSKRAPGQDPCAFQVSRPTDDAHRALSLRAFSNQVCRYLRAVVSPMVSSANSSSDTDWHAGQSASGAWPPAFHVEPGRAYARDSGALPGPWAHKAHNPGDLVMNCRHRMKHPELETPLVFLACGTMGCSVRKTPGAPSGLSVTKLPRIRDSEGFAVIDRIICESLDVSWGTLRRCRASASSPAADAYGSAAGAPLAKTRAPFQVSHPTETHAL